MYLSDDNKGEKEKSDKEGAAGSDDDEDAESEDSEAKEAKAREKWERKLYKPTGPDGQGWGDFRVMNDQEKLILEELLKIEQTEQKRKEKLIMLD